MTKFENITIESLKTQINLIKKLNFKFENGSLEIINGNEEDYKKILVNLENSNNYISKIIELFKQKIIKELDLKKNGYFISQYDITSNNETFYQIIEEALAIAQNLDNNEYVDIHFDEIMREFRESFVTITKYMGDRKQELFLPVENTLRGNYFTGAEQQKISSDLKKVGADVLNSIKNENNHFLGSINEEVKQLLDKKDYLNQLVLELDTLFSEESLENIAKLYEQAFTNHLNIIEQSIQSNKNLTYQYFNDMENVLTNNKEAVRLLQKHAVDKSLPRDIKSCYSVTGFEDYIDYKVKGTIYSNKYNNYKNKFQISKDFIKSEIYAFIIEEYKTIVIKLKEILLSFKKNKISDKYPYLNELSFIDDHMKIIDNLYIRLNRFISNDKFNNYYLPLIENFKKTQTNNINEIEKNIDKKYSKINPYKTINSNKDICFAFIRIRVFTCSNGCVKKRAAYEYACLDTWSGNNNQILNVLSIYSDPIFDKKFNDFFLEIKNRVDNYSEIINKFKENVVSIESNIIQNNNIGNYFLSLENKTNSLLSEKYSDNLIKASYKYYKDLLDERLQELLNDISNKWNSSFTQLKQKVTDNLNNFTSSISELGIMAILSEAIISSNLTKFLHTSILEHQKSEFNYTISYYYNSLIQNITSVYQFIYNQIPTNQEGFNNIINLRKAEVEEKFNNLINGINESKREALSNSKQLNVLDTSSQNFFKTNGMFSDFNAEFSQNLKNIGYSVYGIKNNKNINEMILACRFYLENSLNGLQIQKFYQPINENIFIDLKLNNFKDLMIEKWIFDQDDFINKLNISLYNMELNIKNEVKIKNETYKNQLESKITEYYTKEMIASKINENYNNYTYIIDNNMIKNFTIYITESINTIKKYILDENKRIKYEIVTYTNDSSLINNRINEYKNKILNKIEEYLFTLIDNLYENILEIVYTNHIEKGLNDYLSEVDKKYKSKNQTYESFSSSYSICDIIYDIVYEFVSEYKDFTKYQIEFKRDENKKKFKKEIIDEIGKLYDNQINPEFNKLLDTLKDVTKGNNQEGIGFTKYDFNDTAKNGINSQINSSLKKIENNLNITIKKEKIKDNWPGNLDYSGIDCDNIEIGFNTFIQQKIDYEKKTFYSLLKDTIRNNFNILLNNLVDSFGNEFFDRIIKYNENFKITSLYNDLRNSLVLSLSYYEMLNNIKNKIDSLTEDLKIKLFNLNNLDLIASEKNKKVLDLLNKNVEEFITNSMNKLLNHYKLFLKEDTSIKTQLTEKYNIDLAMSLEEISSDLEQDYISLFNEKFKKKIINSFTKVMNKQTQDMIETVDNFKVNLKILFDDLFSISVENVLKETNNKINETLDSINKYNNHLNSIKIPDTLIEYMNNYGKNVILPSYKGLYSLINIQTKYLTLKNVENNIGNYEKSYNEEKFIQLSNNIYSSIKNYIQDIYIDINETHGMEEFPKKYQAEINKNLDKGDNYITDQTTENSLQKLLNISENTHRFVKSFEYFEKFKTIIQNNIINLNNSYNQSHQLIDEAFNEEQELLEELQNKADNLYNMSLNYYQNIAESYNSLKSYIEESLIDINNLLNQCVNITYETIEKEFEKLSSKYNDFSINETKLEDEKTISEITKSQNTQFTTEAKFENIENKVKFEFSYKSEGEGQIKNRKIFVGINNHIKPEKVTFDIINKFDDCSKEYQTVEVEFNNINYTTNLIFDTKSNLVNLTQLSDFDSFNYNVAIYKVEINNENKCIGLFGLGFCLESTDNCESPVVVSAPSQKKYDGVSKNNSKLVDL